MPGRGDGRSCLIGLSGKTALKHPVMENILNALQVEHRAEKLCMEASGRVGGVSGCVFASGGVGVVPA